MTVDPLGIGPPSLAPAASQQPQFIGVQPWAVPTYPGATPFSPPTTTAPTGPLAQPAAPIGVLSPRYEEGAENALRGLTVEDLARLQARMVTAGLIDRKERFRLGLADDTTVKAYYGLLGFANRYGITDDEALTRLETVPVTDAAGNKDDPSSTHTSTSTQASLTPEGTAQATLRQIAEEELGRAPSAREYRVFQRALNAREQASPTTSTTTTTTGADGNSTSNTVTDPSTAPSAAVFADQTVRSGELGVERNTRKAVDYMDVAMSVLGAGGQGASFNG